MVFVVGIKNVLKNYPKNFNERLANAIDNWREENSNMIIIEGRKNARKGIKVLPPLIVHNKDNEYRDEIKKMFGGDRNESKEL